MKIIINEDAKGFLFKKGKFVKMVNAGAYFSTYCKRYEICKIDDKPIALKSKINVEVLATDEEFIKNTIQFKALDTKLTLHFVNDIFVEVLKPGDYYFWNINRKHTFICLDLNNPEIPDDFPTYLFKNEALENYFYKFEIGINQKGVLFYNNKFVKLCEPGKYYFLKVNIDVNIINVESCLISQDIVGQEILTNDKVSLRINCVCNYIINDYVKIITEVNNYKNQLYVAIQLALRDYVGNKSLDTILTSKNEMSSFLLSSLKEKAKELYLEIKEIAVKDLILPGEIRNIMNTVLLAEKKAQANVITRREEVASTRSLLNTARLMEENKTLYKLKELEYVERICEKVGNINLTSGNDILSQLTTLLSSDKH